MCDNCDTLDKVLAPLLGPRVAEQMVDKVEDALHSQQRRPEEAYETIEAALENIAGEKPAGVIMRRFTAKQIELACKTR